MSSRGKTLEYVAVLTLVAAIVLVIVSQHFKSRVEERRAEARRLFDNCKCCELSDLDPDEQRVLDLRVDERMHR